MRTLILTIVFISANCSHAETLSNLRLRVDTWLTNHFSILNSRQNTYKAAHGHFFQGLITHSVIPPQTTTSTNDAPADLLAVHPTDQTESWVNLIPELSSENLAGAIKLDIYNGPSGQGWVVTVYVRFNGVLYRRVKAVGGEATVRDSTWSIYDPDE